MNPKKYPFHGGCLSCKKYNEGHEDYCCYCMYYVGDWDLPYLGDDEYKKSLCYKIQYSISLEEDFKNSILKYNKTCQLTDEELIENHINNLTIQEALDIVDKKVEGRE